MKPSALLSRGEQKSLCATNPFALLKVRLCFLKNAPAAKQSRSWPARRLLPQLPVFLAMVAALLWAPLSFSFVMGPTANFDWSMPERFGLDQDGDGIIDIPNTAVYGQPSGFTVNFDASLSVPGASPIVSHIWTIAGGGLAQAITLSGAGAVRAQPQGGRLFGDATVTDADGLSDSITRTVVIKDIFIVAIGDSYASGEGNPDIPQGFDSVESRCNCAEHGLALAMAAVACQSPHLTVERVPYSYAWTDYSDEQKRNYFNSSFGNGGGT